MNNNDIVDRIIELRTNLGYKQYEMSEKLGLKQGSLSDIERRKTKKVTDQLIMLLCHEFNVNEEWLRHGTGKMFVDKNYSIIDDLIANDPRYHLDKMDRKILQAYIDMPQKLRNILKSTIIEIAKEAEKDDLNT